MGLKMGEQGFDNERETQGRKVQISGIKSQTDSNRQIPNTFGAWSLIFEIRL
jgi:hypothetical protein